MKVIISYPPLNSEKGVPLLSQNRQFQYFKDPTYIYPVVPAQAASLLKKEGFEVIWNDCIAQEWTYAQFLDFIKKEQPDVIAMETKTPVVQEHWKIINDLKNLSSDIWPLTTVLFGDHVTAMPEESMRNSKVDFVLTGGDYDFLLLDLCTALKELKLNPQRYTLDADLEPGIWYRQGSEIKNSGQFKLDHNLNSLPFIDRDLTDWKLYAYKNGNFRRTPGTYIMSGRDCWWGKCTYCSWTTLYPEFRQRKVDNVIDEIGILIEKYKVKEIMDDSGSFPVGEWLRSFCRGMISRGYNRKINLDCNMRFGALTDDDYKLMRKAGFRFLLFGIESANQTTLDRIKKNLTVDTIMQSCKSARRAGLYPHITIMFGYPWESYEDAQKTLNLGKWLLKKDYAYTMQSTVVIPYPGTPLFAECKEKNLLYNYDWSYYDMKNPVMKIGFDKEKLLELVQSLYSVSYSPEFIARKILSIRDMDDIKYFGRAFLKVAGHLFDFKMR
ncbi:MAG: B12-binding domain-containing radical SAM protein [Candidatus Omnitrophica bacterium]|nr:B12-binding domain-containing radical SAM protein [Candidatus Omnitrophota bacterium]